MLLYSHIKKKRDRSFKYKYMEHRLYSYNSIEDIIGRNIRVIDRRQVGKENVLNKVVDIRFGFHGEVRVSLGSQIEGLVGPYSVITILSTGALK